MSKRYYPITGLICRSTIPVLLYSNIEIKIIPREGCRKEILMHLKMQQLLLK